MTATDERSLGRSIIAAQERLSRHMCRTGGAAHWHLNKAAKVAANPKLLKRVAPHLSGDVAKQYLENLPGWIEQTTQQNAKCAELWSSAHADYAVQRGHLIAMFVRYSFSLRSYERFARQPAAALVGTRTSKKTKASRIATTPRMSDEDQARLEDQVAADLAVIDAARAELVAIHKDLVAKLAKECDTPLKEATQYARHGLQKAAENFDVRRGHSFASYAQKWIKAAIDEKMKADK